MIRIKKAFKSQAYKGNRYQSEIIIEIKDKIHTSLPEYLFKVYGHKKEILFSANKIDIFELGEKGKFIQQLKFNDTCTPDSEGLGMVVEDMNFDGFKDIKIQQFVPAGPNTGYYYWLWDQNSLKFKENKDLEMITSPEFNHENKTIRSFYRDNAVTHFEKIYKYINDIPTLLSETKSVADPEQNLLHITIRELKDGQMQIIKEYDEKLQ